MKHKELIEDVGFILWLLVSSVLQVVLSAPWFLALICGCLACWAWVAAVRRWSVRVSERQRDTTGTFEG